MGMPLAQLVRQASSGQTGHNVIKKEFFNMQTTSIGTDAELADKAAAGIERVSGSAHKAVDRFSDVATSAAEQFGERTRKFASMGDRWLEVSQDCVRRHPFATVGIAVGVGLLLAKL